MFPAYCARHRAAILDLSAGGSFTRTLEGSYYIGAPTDGSSAFLAWASSGVRRVEDRGDGLGACLLMEKGATNYVLQSRALATTWTHNTETITANANGGPDASSAADEDALASAQFGPSQSSLSLTGRGVLSQWIRSVSGVGKNFLYLYGDAGVAFNVARGSSPTTTYSRQEISGGSATTNMGVIPADGRNLSGLGVTVSGTDHGAHTEDNYIDLVQLEAGYYPTSAIRTTTASVTRPQDTLSYASGSYPVGFLTDGVVVTFAPDASSAEIVSASEDWRLVQVGANDYVQIVANGGVCKARLVCGGSVVGTLTITFSRGQALTITAKPSAGSITVSGATTGDGTNTGTGAAWASSATLYIAGDNVGFNPATGRYVGARISKA